MMWLSSFSKNHVSSFRKIVAVDTLLRSRERQTVVSLAQALEVSDRTIRSDLAFLRDRYNAPLEFNRQKGHHYNDPEWRLPSISLSRGELFALTGSPKGVRMHYSDAQSTRLRRCGFPPFLRRTAFFELIETLSDARCN